jgi:hypothetical protein
LHQHGFEALHTELNNKAREWKWDEICLNGPNRWACQRHLRFTELRLLVLLTVGFCGDVIVQCHLHPISAECSNKQTNVHLCIARVVTGDFSLRINHCSQLSNSRCWCSTTLEIVMRSLPVAPGVDHGWPVLVPQCVRGHLGAPRSPDPSGCLSQHFVLRSVLQQIPIIFDRSEQLWVTGGDRLIRASTTKHSQFWALHVSSKFWGSFLVRQLFGGVPSREVEEQTRKRRKKDSTSRKLTISLPLSDVICR